MRTTHPGGRRVLAPAAIAAGIAGALLVASALTPDAAMAASEVGKNIGKEIETWGKAILLGVVGLVAIPVLLKRDVAGGAVITALAVLVGGFVFAPGAVKGVISSIWRAIGG